jgi:hypothetical protein
LKTAGEAWDEFEDFAGMRFDDARVHTAVWRGMAIDAEDLRGFDDRAT